MYANDSTLRNGDESNDKPQKLEFDGSNRTLGDYTDIAEELDCLQLDDEKELVTESDKRQAALNILRDEGDERDREILRSETNHDAEDWGDSQ